MFSSLFSNKCKENREKALLGFIFKCLLSDSFKICPFEHCPGGDIVMFVSSSPDQF